MVETVWHVRKAGQNEREFGDGWEPFAVTEPNAVHGPTIWLRKAVHWERTTAR